MTGETVHPVDDDAIDWREHTSKLGRKYEVGYPKDLHERAPLGAELTKTNFGISVNWPVSDSSWKNTDAAVQSRAAITRYALWKYDGLYTYKLMFTNTEHYNYYFYDETGDSYQVNTYRNGDHYVRYGSDSPNIVYISGS